MPQSKETVLKYQEYSFDELSDKDQRLIKEAENAQSRAHAPYSGFKVGCSLKLNTGEVFSGNNQENAAYPSGLCAERVVLFAARSQTKEPIDTMVIIANSKNGQAADAFSCGSCRQSMAEYANMQEKPIRLLMRTSQETFIVLQDVKELLPFHFNSVTLG